MYQAFKTEEMRSPCVRPKIFNVFQLNVILETHTQICRTYPIDAYRVNTPNTSHETEMEIYKLFRERQAMKLVYKSIKICNSLFETYFDVISILYQEKEFNIYVMQFVSHKSTCVSAINGLQGQSSMQSGKERMWKVALM
jgi:hypothetical protein